MATQSSIIVWRIPWTEEPGVLRSVGSQRVEYDCATEHAHGKVPALGQTLVLGSGHLTVTLAPALS